MDRNLFKNRLVELRGDKTRKSVANAMGLNSQTLERYEKGDRLPDIEIIDTIANYYNVSADYLLGRTDIKTADINERAACEYTGLSEDAINALKDICIIPTFNPQPVHSLIEYINNMLVNDNFREIILMIDELANGLVLLNNAVMFEKFISNIIKSDKWDINIKKAYLKAISRRYGLTAIDMVMVDIMDYSDIFDKYANGVLSEKNIDSLLSYYSRAIEKRIDYIKYDISQKLLAVIGEITSHKRLTDMDFKYELNEIVGNMYIDKEITSEQQNDLLMALMELHNQISEDVEEDDISLNGLTKSNDQ